MQTGGGGGEHVYLRVPDAIPSRNGWLPGVDLKGVGSYVIGPGSVHPNGTRYRWVGKTTKVIPDWLRAMLPRVVSVGASPVSSVGSFHSAPTAPDFLARLRGVKRISGGWLAHCPAHADTNASLSVRVLKDGSPWLKCFAGCDYHAILAAIECVMNP